MTQSEPAPKISVAVVSYNHGDFLRQCIDSIISQEYPNIEIVIGDDASTDGSQALLLSYRERYPNIIKLHLSNENQGPIQNINKILAAVTGELVAFIDGDDLMFPEKLRKQVALMSADPSCVLSYHNVEVFNENENRVVRYSNSGKDSSFPYTGSARELIRHGTFFCTCSVMFRRESLPSAGLDSRLHFAADWLLWIEITANGGKIKYLPDTLGRYRRHDNNWTNAIKPADGIDEFITLAIVDGKYPSFAKDTNIGRARLWYARAVRRLSDGKIIEGRRFLGNSISAGIFTWKQIVRYVMVVLPGDFLRRSK